MANRFTIVKMKQGKEWEAYYHFTSSLHRFDTDYFAIPFSEFRH